MTIWYKLIGIVPGKSRSEHHDFLFALHEVMFGNHFGQIKVDQYPVNIHLNKYFDSRPEALLAIISDLKYHYFVEIELYELGQYSSEANLAFYWYHTDYTCPKFGDPFVVQRYNFLRSELPMDLDRAIYKLKRTSIFIP